MEVLLIQHGTILLSLGTVQSQIGLFHQLTDLPRGINTADADSDAQLRQICDPQRPHRPADIL